MSNFSRQAKRTLRHRRIRKKISGTPERPRLCVSRSAKNFSAQVIDDANGVVLLGMSTLAKDVRASEANGGNIKAAESLGEKFGAEAVKKGIKLVSFDRGGYMFHGRVKAFADAARKAGMEF